MNERDITLLINKKTNKPHAPTKLPTEPDQIGYQISNKISFTPFSPHILTSTSINNLTSIEIKHKGVYLIKSLLYILNAKLFGESEDPDPVVLGNRSLFVFENNSTGEYISGESKIISSYTETDEKKQ
jgi:hypothetical protein